MPITEIEQLESEVSDVLTPKRERLLRLIANWQGPGVPLLSTLADELGLSNESAVRVTLKPLEEAGLVQRLSMGPGAKLPKVPQVTELGRAALGMPIEIPEGIPFLGPVHGGDCGVQYDEPIKYVDKISDILPVQGEEYFLPVRGNCMAGGPRPIYEGDIVYFRQRSRWKRPRNGSIAHVELPLSSGEHEPLLRRYWYSEKTGKVTLQQYKPYRRQTFKDEEVEPRGEMVRIIAAEEDLTEV